MTKKKRVGRLSDDIIVTVVLVTALTMHFVVHAAIRVWRWRE